MSALWLILACTLGDAPAARAPIAVDFAMDSDPLLDEFTATKVLSEKYLPLWLQALDRPEADLQRLAAESLARVHQGGYAKMDKAKPALLRVLTAKETEPVPRFCAARALIVFDAKEAAGQLWQAAQAGGLEFSQLVEPALADWKFEPAYQVWRKRLTDSQARHRLRMLAIRCLGEVADPAALPQLLAIAVDSHHPDAERLAAAQAAGKIKDSGLETDARKLAAAQGKVIDRLCAAGLLGRHVSEAARATLLSLAVDPEPAVAIAALGSLNASDPSLVLPLAEKVIQSADSGVRREGVRCFAANPTAERIATFGKLLDDPVLSLRAQVREVLRGLAGDASWNAAVRQTAIDSLQAESWRGQEQAALLLADLDHKPAAPRLVKLLDSTRTEVMIASAWALRKLAVRETLPSLLQKASQLTEVRTRLGLTIDSLDRQAAHLFEALATMHHEPAIPLMKRYIAKSGIMGEYSRSAAIWGLGLLHLGKPDEAMALAITQRVTEPSSAIPPELPRIRLAGAIAIGKMKATSQARALRDFAPVPVPGRLYMTLRWSLRELTGEELPFPDPPLDMQSGWFLEPLDVADPVTPK